MPKTFAAKSISPIPIIGKQMEHNIVLFVDGKNKAEWDNGETLEFILDRAMAEDVITEFDHHGTYLPVDFDHVSEAPVEPGDTPSAVGRIKSLSWVDGIGLVATLILYEKAIRALEQGDVIYHSPASTFSRVERKDGSFKYTLVKITSLALVNHPATIGAIPIAASSNQENGNMKNTKRKMEEHEIAPEAVEGEVLSPAEVEEIVEVNAELDALVAVLVEIGIEVPAEATAADVMILAAEALKPAEEAPAEEEVAEEATKAELSSAISTIQLKGSDGNNYEANVLTKQIGTATYTVDLDTSELRKKLEAMNSNVGYVPIEQFNEVTNQLNALLAEKQKTEADTLIASFVRTNKLNQFDEKQMAWAKGACWKDREGFELLMGSAPSIVQAGQVTLKSSGSAATTDRELLIADGVKAHKDEKESGKIIGGMKGYINGKLSGVAGQSPMTTDEEKKFLV